MLSDVTASRSTCQIDDWAALRRALGLTQREMSTLLCLSERQIINLERSRTRRPHPASLMLLRAWLRDPVFRRRLAETGYPHPWPEDD